MTMLRLTIPPTLSMSQVKKRVVQVISAMAHHGYLELEGGELLVRFIVQHCALHDTYQVQLVLRFPFITIELIYVYFCICGLCNYHVVDLVYESSRKNFCSSHF